MQAIRPVNLIIKDHYRYLLYNCCHHHVMMELYDDIDNKTA